MKYSLKKQIVKVFDDEEFKECIYFNDFFTAYDIACEELEEIKKRIDEIDFFIMVFHAIMEDNEEGLMFLESVMRQVYYLNAIINVISYEVALRENNREILKMETSHYFKYLTALNQYDENLNKDFRDFCRRVAKKVDKGERKEFYQDFLEKVPYDMSIAGARNVYENFVRNLLISHQFNLYEFMDCFFADDVINAAGKIEVSAYLGNLYADLKEDVGDYETAQNYRLVKREKKKKNKKESAKEIKKRED